MFVVPFAAMFEALLVAKFVAPFAAIFLALLVAAAHPAAHAGPHEHGVASLELSVDGSTLLVRFSSPLDNLLGWERAPRNEQEQRQYAALRAELAQPAVILSIPEVAACRLESATVSDPHLKSSSDPHKDLEAEWNFRCGAAASLRTITINGFDRFKRLRRVDAFYALPGKSGKSRLTGRQRELKLP